MDEEDAGGGVTVEGCGCDPCGTAFGTEIGKGDVGEDEDGAEEGEDEGGGGVVGEAVAWKESCSRSLPGQC